MSALGPALGLEAAPALRTYATILPLGLRELDAAVAYEAETNPWLEIVERPLAGRDAEEIGRLAASGPTLAEHLETQLAAREVPGALRRAGEYIVGSLDPHGYLREDLAAIAARTRVDRADVELALELVQSFDPCGVAARDLGERFRIELGAGGDMDPLALALTYELEGLAAEGVARFGERRGVDAVAMDRALERLRACDPDPARAFAASVDRVYPEVAFACDALAWYARVNDHLWPQARVAVFARSELSQEMRTARSRARLVVDALARRKTTIGRVASVLLERQRAFFEAGGDSRALVPLTGRQIARDVGCAESTVSRALAERFAETPFGTIALRKLIARPPGRIGLTTAAVRERIRDIVTATPAASDSAISRALALRGIRLARRTVAKYRGELGIETLYARERRR